jgi:hypothetical protein
MSIQKACKLKHQKRPYTMLFNEALQECDDLEMIGLWSHFSTLPEDWDVHVKYICNKYHIGRDKAYSLLRKMEEHGLLEYNQKRDDEGRFIGTEIIILDGSQFTKEAKIKVKNKNSTDNPFPENQETDLPFPEKPDTDKPDTDNRTHTKETMLTKEKESKKTFSNFQNQKPQQSSGYADVTKRSDSWGAPPPETPEEASRKFEAMMQSYGKAIEIAPRQRKAG